jgi:hypothetical protein
MVSGAVRADGSAAVLAPVPGWLVRAYGLQLATSPSATMAVRATARAGVT